MKCSFLSFLGCVISVLTSWAIDTPLPYVVPEIERATADDLLYSVTLTVKEGYEAKKLEQFIRDTDTTLVDANAETTTIVLNAASLEVLARLGFQPINVSQTAPQAASGNLQPAFSPVVNSDDDALTDTEERWWGTNPYKADTDGDGVDDAQEIAQLIAGDTSAGIPWPDWPKWGELPNANVGWGWGDDNESPIRDVDRDCIPDDAERFVLGLNPNYESTDNDRYDDGQEFWGITEVGRGSLPRAVDSDFLLAEMPNFVDAPGASPYVAAIPEIQITIPDDQIRVQPKNEIKTESKTVTEQENIYETTTRNRSTVSTVSVKGNDMSNVAEQLGTVLNKVATSLDQIVQRLTSEPIVPANASGSSQPFSNYSSALNSTPVCNEKLFAEISTKIGELEDEEWSINYNLKEAAKGKAEIIGLNQHSDSLSGLVSFGGNAGATASTKSKGNELGASAGLGANIDLSGIIGLAYKTSRQGDLNILNSGIAHFETDLGLVQTRLNRYYNILGQFADCTPASQLSAESASAVSGSGYEKHSHKKYSEVKTRSYNRMFNRNEWSQATTVDTAHAADLKFNIEVSNLGTDVVREITAIWINIFIGDDQDSAKALNLLAPGAQATEITNLFPGSGFSLGAVVDVPLTLDELNSLDNGASIRIEVERVEFGSDQLFYENAYTGGVLVMVDDGVADYDQEVIQFLMPTWGDESYLSVVERVQDVLALNMNSAGQLASIEVPQFDANGRIQSFETFANTETGRWSIFTQYSEAATIDAALAQPESTVMFYYVKDSDGDGVVDETEYALGTDMFDAGEYPQANLIGGYLDTVTEETTYRTYVIENTGNAPAWGLELALFSPTGETHVTRGFAGLGGGIQPGERVYVGPLYQGMKFDSWTGSSIPGIYGEFVGSEELAYQFSVTAGGNVGAVASTAQVTVNYGPDSLVLDLGESYSPGTPIEVGSNGLYLSFSNGNIRHGDVFEVQASPVADAHAYATSETPSLESMMTYSDYLGTSRKRILTALSSPQDEFFHVSEPDGVVMHFTSLGTMESSELTKLHLALYSPSDVTGARFYLTLLNPDQSDSSHLWTHEITANLTRGMNHFNVDFDPISDPSVALADNTRYLIHAQWTDGYVNADEAATIAEAMTAVLYESNYDNSGQLEVYGNSLDVGDVVIGESLTHSIVFANTGSEAVEVLIPLEGSNVGSDHIGNKLILLPGDIVEVELTFDTSGMSSGALSIQIPILTTDSDVSDMNIVVSGNLISAGEIDPVTAQMIQNKPWDWEITVHGPYTAGDVLNVKLPDSYGDPLFFPIGLFDQNEQVVHVGRYTSRNLGDYGVWNYGMLRSLYGFTLPSDLADGESQTYYLKLGKLGVCDSLGQAEIGFSEIGSTEEIVALNSQGVLQQFIDPQVSNVLLSGTNGDDCSLSGGVRVIDGTSLGGWAVATDYDRLPTSRVRFSLLDETELEYSETIQFDIDFGDTSFSSNCRANLKVGAETIYSFSTTEASVLLRVDQDSQTVSLEVDEGIVGEFGVTDGETLDLEFTVSFSSYAYSVQRRCDFVMSDIVVNGSSIHFYNQEYLTQSKSASCDLGASISYEYTVDSGVVRLYGRARCGSGGNSKYTGRLLPSFLEGEFVGFYDEQNQQIPISSTFTSSGELQISGYATSDHRDVSHDLAFSQVKVNMPITLANYTIGDVLRSNVLDNESIDNATNSLLFDNVRLKPSEVLKVSTVDQTKRLIAVTSIATTDQAQRRLSVVGGEYEASVASSEAFSGTATIESRGYDSGEMLSLIVYDNIPELGGMMLGVKTFVVNGDEGQQIDFSALAPMYAGEFIPHFIVNDASGQTSEVYSDETMPVLVRFNGACSFDSGSTANDPEFADSFIGGYAGGNAFSWGSSPLETVRFGYDGTVSYRIKNLNPSAPYNLNLSFYQPDGQSIIQQVYADDILLEPFILNPDTGAVTESFIITMNEGASGSTAFATTYLPESALLDGEVELRIVAVGFHPATVSTISLNKGAMIEIDSGNTGTDTSGILYDPASGAGLSSTSISYGYASTPMSFPVGNPDLGKTTVRYAPTGRVSYEFGNVDPGNSFVLLAGFEATGSPYYQVSLNDTPLADSIPVTGALETHGMLISSDTLGELTSFSIHIDRVDASGISVPGTATIAELRLLEFGGESDLKRDTDGDGIPDRWELEELSQASALSVVTQNDSDDFDSDGRSNYIEYLTGTDPNDPSSVFVANMTRSDLDNTILIEWPTEHGFIYEVQISTDLLQWDVAVGGIRADNSGAYSVELDIDPDEYSALFIRVSVKRPF